jgi:Oxidoreductase family, C-terminal alpha/beta domain
VRFVGSEGWVETGDNGGIEVHPASLKEEVKSLTAKPPAIGLDVSAHARNFFDCIKTRGQTAANPKVMKNSHIACHAAALSWILQRKLTIDPAREEFVNDDEANGLRSRPARTF